MSDTLELTKLVGSRFIQRKDVKAHQASNGDWHPVKCDECTKAKTSCPHRPMTMQDFEDHFSGVKSMGHYLVDPSTQTCKLFAFDLDARKPDPNSEKPYIPVTPSGEPYNPREAWIDPSHEMHTSIITQVRFLAEGIARRVQSTLEIPVAIADSGGKGLHVYCFTGEIPGEAARELAHGQLESWTCFSPSRGNNFWRYTHPDDYQDVEIETFPKQGTVNEGGMGNLMALPLGINGKTNRPRRFITTRSEPHILVEMDPFRALGGDFPWE